MKLSCLKHSLATAFFIFAATVPLCADTVDVGFNANIETTTYLTKAVDLMVSQPDGKVLAAGQFNNYNGTPVGSLIRLNADGTLDSTFQNDYIFSGTPGNILLESNGDMLLRHGYLVFRDGTEFNARLVRLNADGTLDASITSNLDGTPYGVALDQSGRILVAGSLQVLIDGLWVAKTFVRLNQDGTFDPTFNPAVTSFDRFNSQGNKIIFFKNRSTQRLNEDGSIDTTFTATSNGNFQLLELKSQLDGKILALTDNRLYRLNIDGGVDSGFAQTTFPNQPKNIMIGADSRITVAYRNVSPFGMRVIRVMSDGTADPSFTTYTHVGTEFNGHAVLPDYSMFIGDFSNSTVPVNGFRRLLPNGSIDSGFNPNGAGFQRINPGKIRAIEVLPNDKILIGGDFDRANNIARPKFARLNADSSLDNTFALNTSATGDYFSVLNDIYNIEAQSDGKLLVSGKFTYVVNGVSKQNFVRLNANGSIDPTFVLGIPIVESYASTFTGTNKPIIRQDGRITVGTQKTASTDTSPLPRQLLNSGADDAMWTPIVFAGRSGVRIHDIALQNDGRILLSGTESTTVGSSSTQSGFIYRLNADGSTDMTFQPHTLPNLNVFTINLLPNGKIIGVQRSVTNSTLFRLNGNGSVDNSFNSGIGATGKINSILALPNGKTVVGGLFSSYNGTARTNLALVGTDGSLESDIATINREVLCLTLDNQGRVLVGGQFTSIGGSNQSHNISYLARLNAATPRSPFDFDGDGKTDISIFRPAQGEWWLSKSSGGTVATRFGNATDRLVPGDMTGDGKADIAVFRPSSGEWFVLRSEDNSYYSTPFGVSTDITMPADFDGDGRADIAVYRPESSNWFINRSTGGTTILRFGTGGDVPAAADYDGDGKTDIAIFRPSAGQWWYQRSSNGTVAAVTFGTSTDRIVPGDYTGDGKVDIAVWRPAAGEWFVLRSEDQSYYSFPFGTSTDVPTPGDYDGDGRFDAGVFRPATNNWYVQRSTGGTMIQQFGSAGDVAVPNSYVR